MQVKKHVDLFTRNSEQLDLHLSNFLMIYNRIYKFTGFGNKKKRKEKETLHRGPWKFLIKAIGSFTGQGAEELCRRVFPASRGPERKGKVGGKREGARAHLWIASARLGMAG